MSISDDLMWRYYELLTDLSPAEVEQLKQAAASGERHPRDLKADLGRRIAADFHSPAEAQEASDEFDRMFREHQTPEDVPRSSDRWAHAPDNDPGGEPPGRINLRRAAKDQGQGVRINGEVVTNVGHRLGAQPGEC